MFREEVKYIGFLCNYATVCTGIILHKENQFFQIVLTLNMLTVNHPAKFDPVSLSQTAPRFPSHLFNVRFSA